MYDYEYDDYFEPGEFDEEIERMKEALRKSVKKEIQDELEELREENKNLKGIKEHFEQIKKDYEQKKGECDRTVANAKQNAMSARLVELLESKKLVLWSSSYNYQYKKKCNKCDTYRQVHVTLPSGRVVQDICDCHVEKQVSYPKMYLMYEIADRTHGIVAWYKQCGKKNEEYFLFDSASSVPRNVIDHKKKALNTNCIVKCYMPLKVLEENVFL